MDACGPQPAAGCSTFAQQWRAAADKQKLLTYHQPSRCWLWVEDREDELKMTVVCIIMYCIKGSKAGVEKSIIVISRVQVTTAIV